MYDCYLETTTCGNNGKGEYWVAVGKAIRDQESALVELERRLATDPKRKYRVTQFGKVVAEGQVAPPIFKPSWWRRMLRKVRPA